MSRARYWVDLLLDDSPEESLAYAMAEDFEYLLDHVDEWEDGDVQPGDLPRFGKDEQALLIYSVLFGTLWELAHPSIWAVQDAFDNELIGIYGHEANARERAEDNPYWTVQRMNVADGDKPPEAVIGEIGGETS